VTILITPQQLISAVQCCGAVGIGGECLKGVPAFTLPRIGFQHVARCIRPRCCSSLRCVVFRSLAVHPSMTGLICSLVSMPAAAVNGFKYQFTPIQRTQIYAPLIRETVKPLSWSVALIGPKMTSSRAITHEMNAISGPLKRRFSGGECLADLNTDIITGSTLQTAALAPSDHEL